MLDIADYRVDGLKLRVRLKCSCGGRSIVKMMVGAEPFYRCAKCNAQSSLNQLRNIATMCWRGQIWEVECEELKKEMAPAVTSYPATLTVGPSRQSQPFCVLDGHCIVLSPTGMQFLARNFKKEYFRPIDNEMRYAAVQWTRPVQGLPSKLTGSIVEVKFREEELPICQIRVVFHEFSSEEQKAIEAHVASLSARGSA